MELLRFFIEKRDEVLQLALEHLLLVVVAIGAACAVGIPVGILLTRRARLARPVLAVANVLQTIPSLALFGFLIPLLGAYGIGRVPAIIALFLYSLLPIIRNTYAGITGVDPAVREAARGMGMTDRQMLAQVELPLAMSVIIAGVRVATVIAVGTATIAAAIGAGGLGMYIFRGLRMDDNTLIFAGAVPAAIMALGADFVLGWVEKRFAPGARLKSRKVAGGAVIAGIIIILAGSLFFIVRGRCVSPGGCVVVGSKDFTEQVILGELMAQAIKSRAGLDCEQQFELGGNMCHRAMLAGEMDIYVEYTGTAFMSLLKQEPLTDAREVYNQVRDQYASRFNFDALDPLGFNNTFAILVRGDDARRLNLKKVSDITKLAPEWRAGFGQDFMSREDGYPGFARAYGLNFSEPPREMDLSLTYRALAGGQVDLIAGNSTDGLIDKLDLYQLEDDLHYFPPYEAVPIVRKEVLARYPQINDALRSLAGKITDADMRRLNYAVDAEKRDVKEVVREFLSRL